MHCPSWPANQSTLEARQIEIAGVKLQAPLQYTLPVGEFEVKADKQAIRVRIKRDQTTLLDLDHLSPN